MSTRLPLSFALIAKAKSNPDFMAKGDEVPLYTEVETSLVMRAGAETVTIWKDAGLVVNLDNDSDFDPESQAIQEAIEHLQGLPEALETRLSDLETRFG